MKRQANMNRSDFEQEFLTYLRLLSPNRQRIALAYIKQLGNPAARKNEALLKLAGSFDNQSLDEMEKAIREGCEQIEE